LFPPPGTLAAGAKETQETEVKRTDGIKKQFCSE